MAKQKEAWDKLSMQEKAQLIKLSVDNGVSSLKQIRDTYNLYSNGGQKETLDKVNSSNANFVQRLKDPNRKNIPDWESPTDRISTHKLSVGTDENGNHYIFPEVQEINGELIDFTRPPYHRFAGEISAEMRGDTVRVPSLEDAIKFTETYKQYYPLNNGGNLVHKYDGEQVGQSQKLQHISEVSIIEEPWADVWFKQNKNVAGMAIGKGLNGVDGERRVIINPYNAQMNDLTSRASVLLNERLRHIMDQENFSLPNITKEQIQKYDETSYQGDTLNIGRTEAARYLSGDTSHNLTDSQKQYIDSLKLNYKKSTGGPLYPFSFEKNPFLKTPVVRYDEGGKKQDASNPGGYTDEQLNKNYQIWKTYDPTGGLNFINYVLSQNFGNMARGEENEYWKEYLGLPSAVPLMNSNANTEWDKKIEQEKIAKGELASDFYGTTPRMDYNIQALADTLMLGEMVRNYEEYDKKYNLPHIETVTEAYEQAKNILNNPNKWTQVDGEIEVNNWPFNPNISESNPLGMLANFGMKWVPEENALYMHDTYDFPKRVHKRTEIPVRPREMKIRSKISFDPTKGSWLLRSPVNYNTNIPAKTTK